MDWTPPENFNDVYVDALQDEIARLRDLFKRAQAAKRWQRDQSALLVQQIFSFGALLTERDTEAADLRQQCATLAAQVVQREERIAALEMGAIKVLDVLTDLGPNDYQLRRKGVQMLKELAYPEGPPLPFEQTPAPTNPDAPEDASMRGGLEGFSE